MKSILFLWISSTILSVFAAKYASDAYDVNPVVLSMVQFGAATILLIIFSITSSTPFKRISHRTTCWFILVSVGIFFRETLKFAAVATIGINLFNALKSFGPVILVLLDGLCYSIWPSRRILLPFSLLVLGGFVMAFDSFTGGSMSSARLIQGSMYALLSTLVECLVTILQKSVLKSVDVDDASVQYYTSAFSFVISIINVIDITTAHAHRLPSFTFLIGIPLIPLTFVLIASSLLAFVSTQMAIKSLRLISATKYTILDTFRRLLSSVLAVFVFGEKIELLGAMGLSMSVFAIFMYDRVDAQTATPDDVVKKSLSLPVTNPIPTEDTFDGLKRSATSYQSGPDNFSAISAASSTSIGGCNEKIIYVPIIESFPSTEERIPLIPAQPKSPTSIQYSTMA